MNEYTNYTSEELRAEIEAATFYRDMEASLGFTESARLAQLDIDKMEAAYA